jgi:trigger factor
MSVVLAVEETGPCRRQLKIEVPIPAVEAETSRVVEEYGRRARIPGFRKGKVPPAVVRRHFGEDIRREVMERLVPRYWRQAAAESGIQPLRSPRVEALDFKDGEPLVFTAVVEVRPQIELRNTADFALPELGVEAAPDEIENAIADLRRSHAAWMPVERPAARGDRVEAELLEIGGDGEAKPQPIAFEVGDPQVWTELAVLEGLAAGQQAEFTRKEGEGEAAHAHAYRATVQAVREANLPELDLEFVRHFGDFADVEAFRVDVAGRLRAAKRAERARRRETALLDQLIERHPIPLPEGVVHEEVEGMLVDYAQGLSSRGVDPQQANLDWQALGEQAKPQAERRVHARLLLDAISEERKIEVGEEEFQRALEAIARAEGRSPLAVRQALDESGRLEGLRAQMRREKTVRNLLGEPESTGPAAGS